MSLKGCSTNLHTRYAPPRPNWPSTELPCRRGSTYLRPSSLWSCLGEPQAIRIELPRLGRRAAAAPPPPLAVAACVTAGPRPAGTPWAASTWRATTTARQGASTRYARTHPALHCTARHCAAAQHLLGARRRERPRFLARRPAAAAAASGACTQQVGDARAAAPAAGGAGWTGVEPAHVVRLGRQGVRGQQVRPGGSCLARWPAGLPWCPPRAHGTPQRATSAPGGHSPPPGRPASSSSAARQPASPAPLPQGRPQPRHPGRRAALQAGALHRGRAAAPACTRNRPRTLPEQQQGRRPGGEAVQLVALDAQQQARWAARPLARPTACLLPVTCSHKGRGPGPLLSAEADTRHRLRTCPAARPPAGAGELQVAVRNVDCAHSKGLQLPVVTIRLPEMKLATPLGPRITLPLPSFRCAGGGGAGGRGGPARRAGSPPLLLWLQLQPRGGRGGLLAGGAKPGRGCVHRAAACIPLCLAGLLLTRRQGRLCPAGLWCCTRLLQLSLAQPAVCSVL
jgi:hypothetical protein